MRSTSKAPVEGYCFSWTSADNAATSSTIASRSAGSVMLKKERNRRCPSSELGREKRASRRSTGASKAPTEPRPASAAAVNNVMSTSPDRAQLRQIPEQSVTFIVAAIVGAVNAASIWFVEELSRTVTQGSVILTIEAEKERRLTAPTKDALVRSRTLNLNSEPRMFPF